MIEARGVYTRRQFEPRVSTSVDTCSALNVENDPTPARKLRARSRSASLWSDARLASGKGSERLSVAAK